MVDGFNSSTELVPWPGQCRLRVISGHRCAAVWCRLYPWKRTSLRIQGMSAMGRFCWLSRPVCGA